VGGAIDRPWPSHEEPAIALDDAVERLDGARRTRRFERAPARPGVSIVVPAYNEEQRLERTLPQLERRDGLGADVEVIIVDDGSADRTVEIARDHLHRLPRGRLLRLPWHVGKGAAVRSGVAAAQGDAIVFMDADLATDLSALPPLLMALRGADVAIGSRTAPGAVVTGRSPTRRMLHRGFGVHARHVAGIAASDPQCGFKGFRNDAAKILFALSRLNGFGFDVEILLLADRLGYRIVEIPVRWHAVDGSHVRARDPMAMLLELACMRLLHRGKKPLTPPERTFCDLVDDRARELP
jgi:dolichyl-phosphate beta-glucosyltransferase